MDAHGLPHRHDSVIDITKWAQEYFQKSMSVNTIHRWHICRCQLKLYHAKRKPYVNVVQKRCRGPVSQGSFKKEMFQSGKVFYGQTSPNLTILVGNHRHRVLRVKEEGDPPVCYQHQFQKPASLMLWRCISSYGMGSLHVLEGTMNAERYTKFLEQHMPPLQMTGISAGQCKTTFCSYYNSMAL